MAGRNMSPWQAKSLGSSQGVVAPEDMLFTDSPQDVSDGYQKSFETTMGHDTMQNVW